MRAKVVSADGSRGGPSVARRARSRLLAALIFAALVVLSQSASAQGSEAEEAVQEATAAAEADVDSGAGEAVQEATAAAEADVDSGAGEVPPAEPAAGPDVPVPNAEDDPAAGPSDPVDSVATGPGDPTVAPPVPSDVPEAIPVRDDTGSAPPDGKPPIAASEGASQAAPADATAAPEAPAIAPPPVPVEPLAPARSPSPSPSLKAWQDDLRVAGVAIWRAIPLVRLGAAEAVSPMPPPVALLGSAPAARPTSDVVAAADEERPPRPALEDPGSRSSPSAPDAFVCGGASACAGGFPPSVLILFTALACLCTLLFERLVVASSSWRSESFVSLRERPG